MAPIAPLVAGHWPRRLGGLPGPWSMPGGSGESPSGAVLQVEVFVAGLWTDITSYVMTRDGSYNVSIARGQPNETARTDPGRCSFQLNNRDGRFSPRNPLSPYYGQLGRNQPLRVSVPSGNDKSYRFFGEISEWPQKWDTTGTDVWVEVQAAGILRRLGQGAAARSAAATSFTTGHDEDTVLVAYWPCEDASGATSLASGLSGGPEMIIGGSPTLSTYSDIQGSSALPKLSADGSLFGRVPPYNASSITAVRFYLAVPSAGLTDGQVIASIGSTGTLRRWEVFYATASSGSLGVRGYDASGTTVITLAAASYLLNGTRAQVSIEFTQSGADVQVANNTFSLADSPDGLPTFGSSSSGTATGQTIGLIASVTLAPNAGLTDVAVGHVRVGTSDAVFGGASNWDMRAFTGENADRRVSRICDIADLDFQRVGGFRDGTAMGYQTSATLVDLLQQCSDSDGGMYYELTGSAGLGFRTAIALQNQATALALSYSSFNLSEVPAPLDDDQYTVNDVTVTRIGGSFSRAVLSSGPLSVLPPPAGVGRYDTAVSLSLNEDGDTADQAGWRLYLGTVDEARYPQISVNLAHPSFTSNPALRNQVLAVRPGDRITISGMPAWMPPDDVSQLVLGYSETIDHFQHRITFNCRPESPYRVAVTDDTTFGRADTAGSQLAADVTAAGTTLSVATTSGPLWTTDPAEMPISIRVSGEVMTVTSISGSVSPQTFTVTRAVNGVVKAQTAGTDVRLNQPAIACLQGVFAP